MDGEDEDEDVVNVVVVGIAEVEVALLGLVDGWVVLTLEVVGGGEDSPPHVQVPSVGRGIYQNVSTP